MLFPEYVVSWGYDLMLYVQYLYDRKEDNVTKTVSKMVLAKPKTLGFQDG